MELKDLRDWLAFAVGVIVPSLLGLALLSSELQQSPASVRVALAVAVAMAIVAAGIALAIWRDHQKLKADLGLVGIKERDKAPPLHTVYRDVKRSYRWHGLSAVNELVGQTEVQSAIATQSANGAEFVFVLADPRDWLRMKEHERWENNPTRPATKLIENIQGSQRVVRELQKNRARVSFMAAQRLPSFRIVEIDDRIEVAHYDRAGCGFSGNYLVLEKPKKGNGMLFEWFRRAADLERKNAVLDHLYCEIALFLKEGVATTEIVRLLTADTRFEGFRRRFANCFDWELTNEDVEKSMQYIIDRMGAPL